mmetsp:Transcript_89100/g.235668  ORF Transcript_89100/g.235668 Transcript_89100/m.235668 type:complete len:484 (+) Transcript_89100:885-2336(+)
MAGGVRPPVQALVLHALADRGLPGPQRLRPEQYDGVVLPHARPVQGPREGAEVAPEHHLVVAAPVRRLQPHGRELPACLGQELPGPRLLPPVRVAEQDAPQPRRRGRASHQAERAAPLERLDDLRPRRRADLRATAEHSRGGRELPEEHVAGLALGHQSEGLEPPELGLQALELPQDAVAALVGRGYLPHLGTVDGEGFPLLPARHAPQPLLVPLGYPGPEVRGEVGEAELLLVAAVPGHLEDEHADGSALPRLPAPLGELVAQDLLAKLLVQRELVPLLHLTYLPFLPRLALLRGGGEDLQAHEAVTHGLGGGKAAQVEPRGGHRLVHDRDRHVRLGHAFSTVQRLGRQATIAEPREETEAVAPVRHDHAGLTPPALCLGLVLLHLQQGGDQFGVLARRHVLLEHLPAVGSRRSVDAFVHGRSKVCDAVQDVGHVSEPLAAAPSPGLVVVSCPGALALPDAPRQGALGKLEEVGCHPLDDRK